MKMNNIRINYQDSCINVDSNSLILSWTADTKQTAYEITIRKKDINIYEGQKVNSSDNIIYIKDLNLEPETEYKVKIEIWNESENCSQNTRFRTGILGEFIGKWISNGEKLYNEVDYYKDNRNCLLRKKFIVTEEIKEGFLYIVGLGYYNVYINGTKVGKT